MCMQHATFTSRSSLSSSQIADLRLAASNMTGPARRAFEAEMTLKYCEGNPLMAETVFGWGRQTVPLGLAERRTGIICLGAQAACSGRKRWEEQDEESGELAITFGSSYKTSDFIVDTIEAKWNAMDEQEKTATSLIQLKMDNGPESSGRRTQFLSRMVQLADVINKPIQLLYYPPYHSKYNPIERCWGILELQWNGAKLIDVETMLGWAKKMTWKGLHPVVELSRKVYEKGTSLSKAAMQAVEARLKRDPKLPKYDILINPVSSS